MAKIMLVEDDNNLREIYEARLLAEGYEIVSAKDGEEALALAVKEKPDLIISDVMMPKISGFDMLDILRSTPETKNTKVIMMTALSQAEDKARADKLGADRYLVKSQVTLEDVAKVAREVLTGEDGSEAPANNEEPVVNAPEATTPAVPAITEPAASPATPEPPVLPVPEPETATTVEPPTAPAPSIDPSSAQTTADEESGIDQQINQFEQSTITEAPAPEPVSETPASTVPEVSETSTTIEVTTAPVESTADAADNAAKLAEVVNNAIGKKDSEDKITGDVVSGKKVISPINDLNAPGPDLAKLAAQQDAIDNADAPITNPSATSVVDPGGIVSTPPETSIPVETTQTEETAEAPPQPGEKIDPNSVAL